MRTADPRSAEVIVAQLGRIRSAQACEISGNGGWLLGWLYRGQIRKRRVRRLDRFVTLTFILSVPKTHPLVEAPSLLTRQTEVVGS
jgi:hypothetical protein